MELLAQSSILEELIRNQDIGFYSDGKKIKTDISDFGEQYWCLITQILHNSGGRIKITGTGLESYLTKIENLYLFTDLIVRLWYEHQSAKKNSRPLSIHVDVDIFKFNEHYQQPKEEKILNGLGQQVCDASNWVPETSYFEKSWNFALCSAISSWAGYPHYEHPRDESSFKREMARHAENFMVGSSEQIQRYKKHVQDYLDAIINQVEELKSKPENLFEELHCRLIKLQQTAKCAERIAENISCFGYPEKNSNAIF